MLFRMIYDDTLAQAAYLIGCQRSGEAIIVDPERDIDRYLDIAARENLSIVAVTETHIHADYLSGARQLAQQTGARLYLSAEGGPDWSYRWLDQRVGGGTYDHVLLHDGDRFEVGRIEFTVRHTPGHTPEHIALLVTDRGAHADAPMGILSGDFVFVGDLGRPDLLETAAGQVGTGEPSARQLYESTRGLDDLSDFLQVWPAHGSGSACGKALGAVPQSTMGYERRFSPALAAARHGPDDFLKYILAGQPEPPMYFARMKQLNRDRPPLLDTVPNPPRFEPAQIARIDPARTTVIDTRRWADFREAHLPGAIFAPLGQAFPGVVGSYVDPSSEILLVIDEQNVDKAARCLVRIGYDHLVGYVTPADFAAAFAAGAPTQSTCEIDPDTLRRRMASESVYVLDVRSSSEFEQGNIPGAHNVAHTRLIEHLDELPRQNSVVVNCQGGGRSARACSFLQARGFDVVNLAGGYRAWQAAQDAAAATAKEPV